MDEISFVALPQDVVDESEALVLKYIPVQSVQKWGDNPKNHDIGLIVQSIKKNGFLDPPKWDTSLQGLVEGNGRTTALKMMEKQGDELPRGILVSKETGEWCMPILFGLDAATYVDAVKYAVDHNNLTMAGGDFTPYDMARMWDNEGYKAILGVFRDAGEAPVSMDMEDIDVLIDGFEFDPIDEDLTDLADSGIDELEDREGIVLKVYIANSILVGDAQEAIEALLDDNPGWEGQILE